MSLSVSKILHKNMEGVIISIFILIATVTVISIYMSNSSKKTDIMLGATLGIVVSGIVKVPMLITNYFYKRGKRGKFRVLFGDSAANGNVTLLFAHRELKSKASDVFETFFEPPASREPHANFVYRFFQKRRALPEGIDIWLPLQDFRGANHVAAAIASITNNTAQYRTDKSIANLGFDDLANTIISFGLGFNGFTHTLSELTDKCLFEVIWGKSQRNDSDYNYTDNFHIPANWFPREIINDSFDYALVARICSQQPEGRPSRYFFICAGRTASGTAAAGYYLANRWHDIYNMYLDKSKCIDSREGKRRFLETTCLAIVVKHWFGYDSDTPNAARDADSTASILANKNGEPYAHWFNIVTREVQD